MRITPQVYNENNARYDEELSDLHRQEERLDEADKQFYITVGYLLAIFQHAERLFEVAEIDEKRQIIGLILSNLQLDDKKLSFNLKEPFATVLSHANGSLWQGLKDDYQTYCELNSLQKVCGNTILLGSYLPDFTWSIVTPSLGE